MKQRSNEVTKLRNDATKGRVAISAEPCRGRAGLSCQQGLFGAHGENLLALDFDFNAEGWADVAALDDCAAHPDVAG
jgi:hypothetical protein